MRTKHAFTLIELLIVVAIIAILAAIAVPNFLEAQVRAKVSRVKSDMRSMATALEAYRIDNTKYPIDFWSVANGAGSFRQPPPVGPDMYFARWALVPLTTPVAYMTSLPGTSFDTLGSAHDLIMSRYDPVRNRGPEWCTSDYLGTGGVGVFRGFPYFCGEDVGWTPDRKWRLRDVGPDLWANNQTLPGSHYYMALYDPTNGTVSSGDIVRWGP